MLKFLAAFFSGPLTAISNDLREAYQSKLAAKNDAERIAAEERIAVLEARKSVILSAQSDPIERWVRPLFALPFIVYNIKLIIWDKVMELGTTDPLSPELYNVQLTVLGGYFLYEGLKVLKR